MRLELFILLMICFSENCVKAESSLFKKLTEDSDEVNVDVFSKCYDELGCIDIDSRWYHKKIRPINLRPMDRHIIKTDFLLLKGNSSMTEILYNSVMAKYSSMRSAGFYKKSSVFILIHDFSSNGYTGWVKHLALELLKKFEKVNVISVDWQRGAEPPFDQAVSNARVVALEIIVLIKELKEKFGISFGMIHIIGHGLGAHIAGYVGATYNGIKKITGLDPSGPRFEGMPDVVKLNPSSAKYVEVIHTDAFDSRSQGAKETMGHSDFFINNAGLQKGCSLNTSHPTLISVQRNTISEGEILPGCSHKRSFKYFIEAVSGSSCTFLGIKCDKYEDFAEGKCTTCGKSDTNCKTFGLRTYKSGSQRMNYYLNTAEISPFCMFQYRITVTLKERDKKHNGYFDFILVDRAANVVEASISDPISNFRDFGGESNNTYIYYAKPPKLGPVIEAKVKWNEKKKLYCFIYCKQYINVETITIQFLGTGNKDGRAPNVLCPMDGDTEIRNEAFRAFSLCNKSRNTSETTTRK